MNRRQRSLERAVSKLSKGAGSRSRYVKDPFTAGLGMTVRESGEPEWTLDVIAGGRHRRRPVASVRDLSRETAAAIAGQMVAANAGTFPIVPTLAAVATEYLRGGQARWAGETFRSNQTAIKSFGKLLATPINRIGPDAVRAWHLEKHCERYLAVMSGVFQNAERRGLISPGTNPCRGLRVKQRRFQACYLRETEFRRLGAVLSRRLANQPLHATVVLLLALTGARRSEILRSRWSQITDEGLHLPESKSGPHFVVLCDSARLLLSSLPQGQPTDRIFKYPDGTLLSAGALRWFWLGVRQEAGLSRKARVHDLRHSFASAGLDHGEELTVIGELLGHKDFDSTLHYAHLSRSTSQRGSERVAQRLSAQLDRGRRTLTEAGHE